MTGVDGDVTTRDDAGAGTAGGRPGVPPALDRLRSFVNTLDLEAGVDELASPAALCAWLDAHGLESGTGSVTVDDLDRARAVREALRDLLGGNAGHPVDAASIGLLDAVSADLPLAVRFGGTGHPALRPIGEGLEAALGTLMADIATAVADGTWARLKTCRNDTCRWAYWDGSKNRSGAWCSMAVCGNRMKGRRYRRRRREESTSAS
jgi:predicted RNA-binding Zn ribbon-like protein